MKATFALLANRDIHNLVRKITWDAHLKCRTGTIDSRLPPHISLKQPFDIDDLSELEMYMDQLAGSISPFEVRLTALQMKSLVYEGTEYGLLWIDVEESSSLRELHNRVNRELQKQFGSTGADHDGLSYHFHITVALGNQPIAVYEQFFRGVKDLNIGQSFIPHELAMFVYEEPLRPKGDYLDYKILPLGGK